MALPREDAPSGGSGRSGSDNMGRTRASTILPRTFSPGPRRGPRKKTTPVTMSRRHANRGFCRRRWLLDAGPKSHCAPLAGLAHLVPLGDHPSGAFSVGTQPQCQNRLPSAPVTLVRRFGTSTWPTTEKSALQSGLERRGRRRTFVLVRVDKTRRTGTCRTGYVAKRLPGISGISLKFDGACPLLQDYVQVAAL